MDSVCLLTTSARVNDVNALARIIDEHLIAGHVLLAHHRRKSPLEFTEQITEPAVAITVRLHLPIFLPQHHQVYAGTLELARQHSPIWLAAAAKAAHHAGACKQSLVENGVGQLGRQRPSNPDRLRAYRLMVQTQHVS